MAYPIKIDHKNLKKAIIEIKYDAKKPIGLLLGLFEESLSGIGYKYANRSSSGKESQSLFLTAEHYFYSDKIRIQFKEGFIMFNCVDENYLTWGVYRPLVFEVLKKLHDSGGFNFYERIGVRYVNVYDDIDIYDNINFNVGVGIKKQVVMSNMIFRTEFEYDSFVAILNITLNVAMPNTNTAAPQSIIDIDIIKQGMKIEDIQKLLELIEEAHAKEKEIFFDILKPDYLNTLNPVYPSA